MLALTVPAASIPFQFLRLEAAATFRRPNQCANDDAILNPSSNAHEAAMPHCGLKPPLRYAVPFNAQTTILF